MRKKPTVSIVFDYRISCSIGILVLGLIPDVNAAEATFFHGQSFILPTVTAGDMFKPCSRDAPKDVDGYWTPSSAQIAQLEIYLGAYLYAHPRQFALDGPSNRQYVGFKRGDKQYIYGNFYPQLPDAEISKQSEVPVVVCDGGTSFWGIVYDPVSHAFEAPAFNGPEPKMTY